MSNIIEIEIIETDESKHLIKKYREGLKGSLVDIDGMQCSLLTYELDARFGRTKHVIKFKIDGFSLAVPQRNHSGK